MATNISWYGLRLVKEKGARYDVNRKIACPKDVDRIAREVAEMDSLAEEVFNMITVNTKNEMTGFFTVSKGSLSASIVHPREVFKRALLQNASAIFLLHNHPSGNPKPSREDKAITQRLAEAGVLLGIRVLDHVIIGRDKYFSFQEHGLL